MIAWYRRLAGAHINEKFTKSQTPTHKKARPEPGFDRDDQGREKSRGTAVAWCCLERDARSDEVLGIAVDELDVAADAPHRVELHLRADAAVELAVVVVAILVAGHRVALEVGGERAAHAGFDAVAVEAVVELVLEALVGDTGHQVGARGDLVVVAQAEAHLVDIDAFELHAA